MFMDFHRRIQALALRGDVEAMKERGRLLRRQGAPEDEPLLCDRPLTLEDSVNSDFRDAINGSELHRLIAEARAGDADPRHAIGLVAADILERVLMEHGAFLRPPVIAEGPLSILGELSNVDVHVSNPYPHGTQAVFTLRFAFKNLTERFRFLERGMWVSLAPHL